MADATAARFGARCLRYESGSGGGFCGAVVGAAVPGAGGGRGGAGAAQGGADAEDEVVTLPLPIRARRVLGTSSGPPAAAAGAGRGAGTGRGGAQARQQTIERRFPVAIPDLGIVVGYMFIMHHERTPPQDNFINEIFKVADGKIREIDAVGFQVTAPGRSGYPQDFPITAFCAPRRRRNRSRHRQRLRRWQRAGSAARCTAGPGGRRGAGRGRGGRGFGGPQVIANFPKPPYEGITEARDLAYGSDPKQRIDILTPSAKSSKPRTVIVFVHGGGWAAATSTRRATTSTKM